MSWDQAFFDAIILPGRKPLLTLRDAAQYITKLSKGERELPEWETAIEWLMLVGEQGGRSDGAAHCDDAGAAKA